MKSAAIRIAGLLFGTLVVMIILHPERFESLWWEKYNDPNGNYSVKFPSKPGTSDLQGQLDGGGTAVLHVVYAMPNKSTEYFFMNHDDPRFATMTVEEVLDHARDGVIREGHGAFLDEQHIKIDGRQARDVQARIGENIMINMRLIADGPRIVTLEVETAGQKVDTQNIQNFFDSLKLSH